MQSNHPFFTKSTPTVRFEITSTFFNEGLYIESKTILITDHTSIASTPPPNDALEAGKII